jgi:hypothetical protein
VFKSGVESKGAMHLNFHMSIQSMPEHPKPHQQEKKFGDDVEGFFISKTVIAKAATHSTQELLSTLLSTTYSLLLLLLLLLLLPLSQIQCTLKYAFAHIPPVYVINCRNEAEIKEGKIDPP